MTERDRDEAGRARNARPRDELGRPLPRGEPGVAPIADDLVLTPDQALVHAQLLLDEGRPFAAHEVFEGLWKTAPEPERSLWQGLAQLAVGLTHHLRGNDVGAATVLCRAREHLVRYAPDPPHDIDVPGLILGIDQLLSQLESGPADGEVPSLRLRQSN